MRIVAVSDVIKLFILLLFIVAECVNESLVSCEL